MSNNDLIDDFNDLNVADFKTIEIAKKRGGELAVIFTGLGYAAMSVLVIGLDSLNSMFWSYFGAFIIVLFLANHIGEKMGVQVLVHGENSILRSIVFSFFILSISGGIGGILLEISAGRATDIYSLVDGALVTAIITVLFGAIPSLILGLLFGLAFESKKKTFKKDSKGE